MKNKTEIFEDYQEFVERSDKSINGISVKLFKLLTSSRRDKENDRYGKDVAPTGTSGGKIRKDLKERHLKNIEAIDELVKEEITTDNETNTGCWNCKKCHDCHDSADLTECSDCWFCSNCDLCTGCYDCTSCHYCTECHLLEGLSARNNLTNTCLI